MAVRAPASLLPCGHLFEGTPPPQPEAYASRWPPRCPADWQRLPGEGCWARAPWRPDQQATTAPGTGRGTCLVPGLLPTSAIVNAEPGLPSGITSGYGEVGWEGARLRAGGLWGCPSVELGLGPEGGTRDRTVMDPRSQRSLEALS